MDYSLLAETETRDASSKEHCEIIDVAEIGEDDSKLVPEYENFSDEEVPVGEENKFYEKLPGGVCVQSEILPEHQTPE